LLLDYVGHVYARAEGVAGVVITDKEYPARVAFSLLNKILDEFIMRYPVEKWSGPVQYPELAEYLRKYQDPKQADSIMKVQRDLDDTKVILVSGSNRLNRSEEAPLKANFENVTA